jgi:hypothetical protein
MDDEVYLILFDLKLWNCTILDIIEDNNHKPISIIFKDKDNIIICLITKQENNNFLVKAETIDNFNRWSNVAFEQEYDWNHFYSDCYNPVKIQKELLLIYYNMYKNLE